MCNLYWKNGADSLQFDGDRCYNQGEKGEDNMEIAIAADHGGFQLKEKIRAHLIESGYTVKDFGCYSLESVDFPEYAAK